MKSSSKHFLCCCALVLAAVVSFGASLPNKKKTVTVNNFTKPFTKDTYHPKNCSYDLVTYIYYTTSQIITEDDVTYSKKPNAVHKDVMYAADPGSGTCDPNVNSCDTLDYSGENSLRYKVYYPNKEIHDYEEMPLPVMILWHPGGFMECPAYEQEITNVLADELSRRGFIVFDVEYRRGKLEEDNHFYTSVQDELATYRGQQDGRGVIRTIIKKQKNDLLNDTWNYIFDTTQVFIGGASAGGVMALACAYYRNQAMVDAVNPHDAASLAIGNAGILGPLNADYYLGSTNSQNWPRIAGVLCMWGGLPIPKSYDNYEDSFFRSTDVYSNPPMIAFHGVKDNTVDFKDNPSQDVHFSIAPTSGLDYHSDNSCLNSSNYYTVQGYSDPPGALVKRCSSLNMYNILKALGRYTEIYYDCNMGHGLGVKADFGIDTNNTVAVTQYIAQRTAVFFQTIMNSTTFPVPFGITGRSAFRNCKNNRTSCSALSDAAGCTNDPEIAEPCN